MKISVLIPTFNRAKFLQYTLDSCVSQQATDVEFVVCDDESTDDTEQVVQRYSVRDSRIKYIRQPKNVGMLRNFEIGLSHCKNEYIFALGADDALMPGSISTMLKILASTQCDLLTWPTGAFFYPGTRDSHGQLVFPVGKMDKSLAWIKSSEFLSRQSKNLHYVSDEDCPMIYVKGVASRKIIERVIGRSNGKFYSCSTPDGYSGIVLAGEVNQYVKYNFPLTMHGVSPSSAGVNYISSVSKNSDLSNKFFDDVLKKPMHKDLGSVEYSPLISLMTADFLLTARDLPGWSGHFHEICYKNLINKALLEVADGLMSEVKVKRELLIIKAIANHTGEIDYFNRAVRKIKRNSRKNLQGNAVSPRLIYLQGDQLDLDNVYQATYVLMAILNLRNVISWRRFIAMIGNSIQYYLRSKLRKNALTTYLSE